MELTPSQRTALLGLNNWYNGSSYTPAILQGAAGFGKAQPLDEPVLTEYGYLPMDEIVVGSKVFSERGTLVEVLQVYEHTNLEMYKVHFSDGTFTRCCKDHLWEIQTTKLRSLNRYRVLTLESMLPDLLTPTKTKKEAYKYSIRLSKAINYPKKELDLDPWELGYILGNGNSSAIIYSRALVVSVGNQDYVEILNSFKANDILSTKLKKDGVGIIAISSSFREKYEALGLLGIKAKDKYIPEEYLYGDIPQRKALLAGLLDSDGSCTKNKATFSSKSYKLSLGVIELIRSLGGYATLCTSIRKHTEEKEYTVIFRTPFNPFTLYRKSKNYILRDYDLKLTKRIVRAEYIGTMEGKCILVDSDKHLYITRDYIVTHNTYLVTSFLQSLGNRVKPLLLAETNEAVSVLRKTTNNVYATSTICKALGLSLGFQQHKQVLIKRSDPDLSDYNLLIVDEASQVDVERLSYLQDTNKMILYIGHKSQLPPVNTELKSHDECISPVFTRNYPTFSLLEPVRNTGSIFTFCQEAERLIYQRGLLNSNFKVNINFVDKYLLNNAEAVFNNDTIFLAYTNNKVGELNKLAREAIFGKEAIKHNFIVGDKLILRSPTACFEHKLGITSIIEQCLRKRNIQLDTNTRAKILGITYNTVLGLSCYELAIQTKQGEKGYIYVVVNPEEQEKLKQKMYTSALYDSNIQSSNKKWANYHNLSLVLANAKPSYAMTIHCAQGSTINNVFVDDSDIDKVTNPILKKKLRYVAYSRAKDNLWRIS